MIKAHKQITGIILMVFFSIAHTVVMADSDRVDLPEKLETMDGRKHSLFQENQHVRLIFLDALCPMPHFPDCEKNIETIRRKIDSNNDHAYVIYNSFYVSPEEAQLFSEKQRLNLPAVFDHQQTLFDQLGVYSTPYLIILTKDGGIHYRGNDFSQL